MICLLVFAVVVLGTKYMSLASLCVVTTYFITTILFGQFDHIGLPGAYVSSYHLIECYIVTFLFTASAFLKHRENIKRLCQGTERRLGDPKDSVHITQE